MLTGYNPSAAFNPNLKPNNERPSHGSIMARKLGQIGNMTGASAWRLFTHAKSFEDFIHDEAEASARSRWRASR